MLKEFKEFALKGNVVDLAVGVVIGGAFGKIVTSLVNDIITPVLSILTGGVNFSDLCIVLKAAVGEKAAVVLHYGAFMQAIIDFLIIAASIFMFVKLISKLRIKKAEEAAPKAPPAPTKEEKLLEEIRDILKQKN